MDSRGTVLAGVIIGCEVAFWIILLAGLATRYLLRWSRISRVLLVSVPVTDLVLLVASFVDLVKGSEATGIHGLAAIYLGFSVAFGPSVIRWADQRFAHRFANGPPPVKPPKYGPARLRHEWREWRRVGPPSGPSGTALVVPPAHRIGPRPWSPLPGRPPSAPHQRYHGHHGGGGLVPGLAAGHHDLAAKAAARTAGEAVVLSRRRSSPRPRRRPPGRRAGYGWPAHPA